MRVTPSFLTELRNIVKITETTPTLGQLSWHAMTTITTTTATMTMTAHDHDDTDYHDHYNYDEAGDDAIAAVLACIHTTCLQG